MNDKTQALENRIEALECKCRKLTEIGDKTISDNFKPPEEKMFLENKNREYDEKNTKIQNDLKNLSDEN